MSFVNRRLTAVVVAVLLVGALATAALLGIGPADSGRAGSGASASSRPQSTSPGGTGVVARLPLAAAGSTFAWAPDGDHFLVSGGAEYETRIYDRAGSLVSTFGSIEGWLNSGHVIDGSGYVADVSAGHTGGPTANSWVVANGHGSAAIIVAVPACTGDPLIDWYRDGHYVKAGDKETPYGWSPDGSLVLLGHLDCGSQDAELNGWKGDVDVVDFASGTVRTTLFGVRGEMAFNPSATRIAAQADSELEVAATAGGESQGIVGVRFLSWLDDDHLYGLAGNSIELIDVASQLPPSSESAVWQVPSPSGPRLVADASGKVLRIDAADGSTLLDLSSAALVVDENQMSQHLVSELQPRWWSPDGRAIALESADRTSLALISVDPNQPGSVGSALPTPVGSAQPLMEQDRTDLPVPVRQLVSDAARDALWFLGGVVGKPIDLYRYDAATAKLSQRSLEGTTFDPRQPLAMSPLGTLWLGSGQDLFVFDPDTSVLAKVDLPPAGSDAQLDPKEGKVDPWVSGIAIDVQGEAYVARNWVRSLAVVDRYMRGPGSILDISDGFAMTGGLAVAGGRVYILADPASGLGFGVDATGTGKLTNTKFQAPAIAAAGDKLVMAGNPPGWMDDQGGVGMVEPVMAAADLVAGGPGGVAALYNNPTGELQIRDADGHVSFQGRFPEANAPRLATIAFDSKGRVWGVEVVETGGTRYFVVRLSAG